MRSLLSMRLLASLPALASVHLHRLVSLKGFHIAVYPDQVPHGR